MSAWEVVERSGSAQELHDLDVEEGTGRAVWVCHATEPTVVLGSTQPDEMVDDTALRAAGVLRARRRSGGGAVLLGPEDVSLWIDVIVPRDDALWSDDVGRSSHWLGDVWCAALGSLGVVAESHRGGLVRRPWSDVICFAGLGPGEVVSKGRKMVGLAQRRTRAGARLQTLVLRRWRPEALLDLLSLEADERVAAGRSVARVAGAPPTERAPLLDAFLGSLPPV